MKKLRKCSGNRFKLCGAGWWEGFIQTLLTGLGRGGGGGGQDMSRAGFGRAVQNLQSSAFKSNIASFS
jgi:hypothetical protein